MAETIIIKMRFTYKPLYSGGVRYTAEVEDITDGAGSSLPYDYRKLFLYHKPSGAGHTDAMEAEDCEYQGLVPVHAFNLVGKPLFGTVQPATWEELPETDVVKGPDLEVDTVTLPSDADLGAYAVDRIVASPALVFTGNQQGVHTFNADLKAALTRFKEAYAAYTGINTMMNITVYPEGWEEVTV
jgi:hypothetical protein